VSVSLSFEEKEASVLALALTLALFQYPERTEVQPDKGPSDAKKYLSIPKEESITCAFIFTLAQF